VELRAAEPSNSLAPHLSMLGDKQRLEISNHNKTTLRLRHDGHSAASRTRFFFAMFHQTKQNL
jgi:hypothetical protein